MLPHYFLDLRVFIIFFFYLHPIEKWKVNCLEKILSPALTNCPGFLRVGKNHVYVVVHI